MDVCKVVTIGREGECSLNMGMRFLVDNGINPEDVIRVEISPAEVVVHQLHRDENGHAVRDGDEVKTLPPVTIPVDY